jgi:hypothetical protein
LITAGSLPCKTFLAKTCEIRLEWVWEGFDIIKWVLSQRLDTLFAALLLRISHTIAEEERKSPNRLKDSISPTLVDFDRSIHNILVRFYLEFQFTPINARFFRLVLLSRSFDHFLEDFRRRNRCWLKHGFFFAEFFSGRILN